MSGAANKTHKCSSQKEENAERWQVIYKGMKTCMEAITGKVPIAQRETIMWDYIKDTVKMDDNLIFTQFHLSSLKLHPTNTSGQMKWCSMAQVFTEWREMLGPACAQEFMLYHDVSKQVYDSIWEMDKKRWCQLIKKWQTKAASPTIWLPKLINYVDQANRNYEVHLAINAARNRDIFGSTDVIGATLNGFAHHFHEIAGMEPKCLIIEEAAWMSQPHLIAALVPSIQHLILIRDHQQLPLIARTHIRSSSVIAAPIIHLDVSLFEIIIKSIPSIPRICLRIQHWADSIHADILCTIYNDLKDDDSINQGQFLATGMDRNLFFIDHEHEETCERDTNSMYNTLEAVMVVALAKHLYHNGHMTSGSIAILMLYKAQESLINKRLEEIKVHNLDQTDILNADDTASLLSKITIGTIDRSQVRAIKKYHFYLWGSFILDINN